MINMIKSDLYRIFKGKAIYIAMLALAVIIGASLYELTPGYVGVNGALAQDETYFESENPEGNVEILQTESISDTREKLKAYPYALDKGIAASNANLYYIFIVVVAIIISTDLSKSTVKNTLSSAISRSKYYGSKLICCLLVCTAVIVLNNYGVYFINILVNGKAFSSSLGEMTRVTLYQLPLMYGIISLLVCISAVVRKNSAFNGISIPLLFVCQLLFIAIIKLLRVKSTLRQYEYQTALSMLARNPANEYVLKCTLLGMIYIVIFNLIGYYSFKRADIK
ncbi:MAG: ABC transporter permease [Muribaculaceae bacterium]|nr:ABC transporter permease [Muribaculaceae bacterium]MCM1399856.1 ABC transporter permease [Clostridium sp.]MCM1460659.1 ABC transporter permease [Bacteroides sp.]